jgi:hypothetical protein
LTRRMLHLAALPLVLAAAIGCGRKGSPRPPQWVVPNSPEPVLVEDTDRGVRILWKRPRAYADGSSLDDLGSFEIERACEPDTTFRTIGVVRLLDRDRFRKEREFSVIDLDVPKDAPCRYRVVAVTIDEYRSDPAESPPILRGAAPPAAR